MEKTPKVFVSYTRLAATEAALARTIADRLTQNGCEVFIDLDIKLGQDWNEEIERALDACDVFCVLLSAASVERPMVQQEIEWIGQRRLRENRPELWPIRCNFEGKLPYDIGAHLRRAQYLGWKGEAGTAFVLDGLLDRLRELREGPDAELPLPRLCTLPARVGDFTGRESELERLCGLLTGGERRATISAIGGMGGVGKTTLALEAAWRVAGQFPDGVLFVDMRGFGKEAPLTAEAAAGIIVQDLDPTARLPDGRDERLRLYRRMLAGKRMLLVLDNAKDASQITGLMPPEPVALLVTSRRKLALPGAARIDLDVMDEAEALALLREIVGPDGASDEELAALAAACGRLPLALRAAGSYLATYGAAVTDYLKDIATARLAAVSRYGEDDPALDVKAVLAISLDQLAKEDAPLAGRFAALAVFPAGFDAAAAAAVWQAEPGAAREALGKLVARSLVRQEAAGRFRLHDLVRDLAAERLGDAAREEAQARHAEHYCGVLAKADDLFLAGNEGVLAGLALFDAERANIEAGQAWAAARLATSDDAARLAFEYTDAGVYVLELRLPARLRIAWLEAAAEACRRTGDRQGLGAALGNLGLAWAALGEVTKAIGYYEQRLVIAREIGDRQGLGNALGNLGIAWKDLGQATKAIGLYEQQLEIAREIGDRRGEGAALGNLGIAWKNLGEVTKAIEYMEQVLAIMREIGDRRGEGNALGNLGLAWADLGEARKAIGYYEQHLAIAREIGDRRGEGNALGNLGIAWAALGEAKKAIGYHEQALAVSREIGDRRAEGQDLGNLGNAWADLGEATKAIGYYEQQLEITKEIGDRLGESRALRNAAIARDELGERERAIADALASLRIKRAAEDPKAKEVEAWLRERNVDPDAAG